MMQLNKKNQQKIDSEEKDNQIQQFEKIVNEFYNFEQKNLAWIKYAYIIIGQICVCLLALNLKLLSHWNIYWRFWLRMWFPFISNAIILKILRVDTYIQDKILHRWFIFRGLLGFIGLVTFVYSLGNLPISEATMIQMTAPIWISIVEPCYLGEKFYYSTLAMIFSCFFGLTLIMKPSFLFQSDSQNTGQLRTDLYGNQVIGYVSCIINSIAFAWITLITKKLIGNIHNLVILHGFYAFGALFAVPICILYSDIPQFKYQDIMPAIIVSFAGTCFQILHQRSFMYNRVSLVSGFAYIQIVLTIAVDFFFFDFIPDYLSIVGALLILISCLAVIFFKV